MPAGASIGNYDGIAAFDVDPDAGLLWIVYGGVSDAGLAFGGIVALDDTTFATLQDIPGQFYSVVAAPQIGKVFVGNTNINTGNLPEIDVIDEQSYAVAPVASLENFGDRPFYLAYDPVEQRVYASVLGNYVYSVANPYAPSYLVAANAVQDQLLATYVVPDAGYGDGTCASTSCVDGFNQIAVDWSGQKIYLLSSDFQTRVPMAATFTLAGSDGGALSDILGGPGSGWYTEANGIATFDGGGAVAIGLADAGGGILQILDPVRIVLSEASTAQTSVTSISGNTIFIEGSSDASNNLVLTAEGEQRSVKIWQRPADGCMSRISELRCSIVDDNSGVCSIQCNFQITPNASYCSYASAAVIQRILFDAACP